VEGKVGAMAYCPYCMKYVKVMARDYIDANDEGMYEGVEHVCAECEERIPYCIDCANFVVIEDVRPWYRAVGGCKYLRVLVLAGSHGCIHFEEER